LLEFLSMLNKFSVVSVFSVCRLGFDEIILNGSSFLNFSLLGLNLILDKSLSLSLFCEATSFGLLFLSVKSVSSELLKGLVI